MTTVRKSNKTKALLCGAAALALLIGGGSTYALWSDQVPVLFTTEGDSPFALGEWSASVRLGPSDVQMYDVSADLDEGYGCEEWLADEEGSSISHDHKRFYDLRNVEDVADWADGAGNCLWTGDWESDIAGLDYDGYPIELKRFPLVPGDTVLAVVELDTENPVIAANLTGQNLKATIDAESLDLSGVNVTGKGAYTMDDILVVEARGISETEVALVISFPLDFEGSGLSKGSKGQLQSVNFAGAIELTGSVITITQDR
ncbi:MAG: hypothetical protein LBB54_05980 [Cellulomonadaceae bacterium]|jgi:hypothetical protein|nr:hypothetical protein [Cellulomonadaceae bacterium]